MGIRGCFTIVGDQNEKNQSKEQSDQTDTLNGRQTETISQHCSASHNFDKEEKCNPRFSKISIHQLNPKNKDPAKILEMSTATKDNFKFLNTFNVPPGFKNLCSLCLSCHIEHSPSGGQHFQVLSLKSLINEDDCFCKMVDQ